MGKEFLDHAARTLNNREASAVERSIFGDQPTVRKQSDAFDRKPVLYTAVDVSTIDAYFNACFARDVTDDAASDRLPFAPSKEHRDEPSLVPGKGGDVEVGREASDGAPRHEAGLGRIT